MEYPILRVNRCHIRKFSSEKELRLMSQKYFDDGDFRREAFIIDSSGNRYPLLDVTRVRHSWNPFRWFRPSPAIIVDVRVGSPSSLPLREAKDLIVKLVTANEWYTQSDQSASEFSREIRAATTHRELIDKISFYGKWQG